MITRREWMKQAAGVTAVAAMPGLMADRALAKTPANDSQTITGDGSLKAHAAARGLLTGCAVNAGLFRDDESLPQPAGGAVQHPRAGELHEMESAPRPTAETYSFDDADSLVAFAEDHGMKVRGHNFVWHEALPRWFAGTVNKDNAEKFLVDHIRTVGGRYKGKIHSWDVVNEAIWIQDGRPDGLRSSSPWFEMLGPGYIDLAFRTARETDPNRPADLQRLRNRVRQRRRGEEASGRPGAAAPDETRTTCPSMRWEFSRTFMQPSKNGFGKGVRELSKGAKALGLQVFITEMDVKDDAVATDDIAERDKIVADVYRSYLNTALEEPELKAV